MKTALFSILPAALLALTACGGSGGEASQVKIKGGAFHNNGDIQPRVQVALMECNRPPNGLSDLSNAGVCQRTCTGTIVASTWILSAAHCASSTGTTYAATYTGSGLNGYAWKVDRVEYPFNTSATNYRDPTSPTTSYLHDLELLHLVNGIPLGGQNIAAVVSNVNPSGRQGWIGGTGEHENSANPSALLKWRIAGSFSVDLIIQQLVISDDEVDSGDSGSGFFTYPDGVTPNVHAVLSSHRLEWPFDRSNYTYIGFAHYPWVAATIAAP